MTVIPWSLVKRLKLELNAEDSNYTLVTASGDNMTVLGTTVVYLHPDGSDTRPVYGIVTDDLGEAEILLSYTDMRDWGLLSSDFPKVKPMKTEVRTVATTPRKNVRLPVSIKTSPAKAPRRQKAHKEGILQAEKDSILECNDRV